MILSAILLSATMALEPVLPSIEAKGRAVRSAPKRAAAKKPAAKKQAPKKEAKAEKKETKAEEKSSSGPGFLGTMAAAAAGSYVGSALADHFSSDNETENVEETEIENEEESIS